MGGREQPLRVHQHGPAVQLVESQQQRSLPRLAVLLAAGPIHDAAAAPTRPGVLRRPRPEVPGALGGPDGRRVVAGSHIICKNRVWGQKVGGMELGGGASQRLRGGARALVGGA